MVACATALTRERQSLLLDRRLKPRKLTAKTRRGGTGTGTSTVQLGSGHNTVFAFGSSTITTGAGSADIAMAGRVSLVVTAGAGVRSLNLFGFGAGADHLSLQGFGASTASRALAGQVNAGGITVLALGSTTAVLAGVARADAGLFM